MSPSFIKAASLGYSHAMMQVIDTAGGVVNAESALQGTVLTAKGTSLVSWTPE